MRRRSLAVAVALLMVGVWPAGACASLGVAPMRVSVTPRSVGPRTTVVVRFRMPVFPGVIAGLPRHDALVLSGPRRVGCIPSADVGLGAPGARVRVRVVLAPAHLGGVWCEGSYAGSVVQSEASTCGPTPARVCPQFVLMPVTLARFHFHVAAR